MTEFPPDEAKLAELLETLYRLDDCDHFDLELADYIVETWPEEAAAWAGRARTHFKLEDYEAAANDVAEALRRDAAHPDAIAVAAALARDVDGDDERSLQLYDTALRQHPDHYGLLLGRSWTAMEAGDNALAIPLLKRAVAARPDRRRAMNNLVCVLLETGRADEAVALHEARQQQGPYDPVADYNVGTALMEVREYQRALPFFDRARADGGEWNALQHNRASCLKHLERYQDAIDEWTLLLEREPDWDWPRQGRMRCLVALHRYDEAQADARHLVGLNPHDVDARFQDAYAFYARDENEAAIQLLDATIAEGIADAATYNLRGACRQELGQYAEAKPDFLQALAMDPEQFCANRNLAETELALGNPKLALSHAEIAIALRPEEWRPRKVRAEALAALYRVDDAVAECERWLAGHTGDGAARRLLASLLYKADRHDAALIQYQQLLRQEPDSGYAAWGIAGCFEHLGRKQEARAAYQRAATLYRSAGDAEGAAFCERALAELDQPRSLWRRLFR